MTDNPVHLIFDATPSIVQFLHSKADHLLVHRKMLQNLSTPTPDEKGLQQLRAEISQLFPNENPIQLFPSNIIQKLYGWFSSEKVFSSVDDTVYFQVGLVLMRLAHDYIGARELYEAHKDGFGRSLVRFLDFNSITGEVNWESLRKRLAEVLKESFPGRYQDMLIEAGEYYRDSTVQNEALMIGFMLVKEHGTHVPQSDGIAFEKQCEEALMEAGFSTELTPASSDYGVDIIARKNGLSYAIQCKRYNVPVGISAVQEATAGRKHYLTDYAVVVATSGFTSQARNLAQSNSVLLITSAQMGVLEELVRATDV